MTAQIHPFTGDMKRAPQQITLTVERLAELLVEAETMGGWRALQDYENEAGRVAYLAKREETKAANAHFWEARIRGEVEKRK